MSKYIVSGYIGFDNFGDEAIADILVQKLKKNGAERITLISSNPQKTAKIHGVNSCGMLNFLPDLLKSDILISGGGSLLQDVTSFKSLLYYLIVIFAALFTGKKVEIFAQGIGPINSKTGQILTRFALKNCSKITVRDKKSQELLKNWGIESTLVDDPVFEMQIPQKNNKGVVGIQLRQFNGVSEEFLNNLADSVLKYFPDKSFKLISLQDSADLEICETFAEILKSKGIEKTEILKSLSLKDVFEVISDLEYLVAMRFHANVAGIKSGVKTLGINYDPKVEQLAKSYNLPLIELGGTNFDKEFDRLKQNS